MGDLGEYREGGIWASTEMVKSGRVPKKGRIRASIGNGGSGRVPEMWDLGEYRKCGIQASTGKVKSERVPEKVGSERVSEIEDPGE